MKRTFYTITGPDGYFFRTDTRKQAEEHRKEAASILGAWPMAHMPGASWPWLRITPVTY